MSQLKRYPGPKPFEEHEAHIFKGREDDATNLHRLIRQEPLVVLKAKSGVGKSSLIKAGLLPQLRASNIFLPLEIRFDAAESDGSEPPVDRTRRVINKLLPTAPTAGSFMDQLIAEDNSLWRALKELQLCRQADATAAEGETSVLLIFDQFEELFTYPAIERREWQRQLAEVLNGSLPQRYYEMLDFYGDACPISFEEKRQLRTPLRVHVLLGIREDRISLLGEMKDYLPVTSRNWYELASLSRQGAAAAIEEPAAAEGDFLSDPFTYQPEARNAIISYLAEGGEGVETPHLQLICDVVESRMLDTKNQAVRVVTLEALGDLDSITRQYYDEKMKEINDPAEQLAARVLLEEDLIWAQAERRLTKFGGLINLKPATLKKLVDSYLLRRTADRKGGYNYELSHDSLVKPILEFKEKRLALQAEQTKAAEEAQREEELREEREAAAKTRRQNAFLRIALAVAAVAVAVALYLGAQKVEDAQTLKTEKEKLEQSEKNLKELVAELEDQKAALIAAQEAREAADREVLKEKKLKLLNEIKNLKSNQMTTGVGRRIKEARALNIEDYDDELNALERWFKKQ